MSDADWVIDLRSCLTSVKDGILLSQIESDLMELTGTKIPYENLGYQSLEACLSSSDEFVIRHHSGVKIVYAVNSNKTKHITELIKKQKSKTKKKILNTNQIKVPELKKRNFSEYDKLSLFEEVDKCNKYCDVSKLLSSVEQWDIETRNQFKTINNFECIVCDFKTNEFNSWKHHIMSINHLRKCDDIEDLYSHACAKKTCKVLIYGPKNSLNKHKLKHAEKGFNHMSIIMAEVMKRFITKQNDIMYYCSHCKKLPVKPIYFNTEKKHFIKYPVEYYCKYCRIDFYSNPEMIDYHSLSVEHMTLKCFDKLSFEVKINYKKMKTSEQSNENKEDNLLSSVEKEIIDDSLLLPKKEQDIILFENSDPIKVVSKNLQTVQLKKSTINVDVGSTIQMDEKTQVLNPVNCSTISNEMIDRRSKLDGSTCSKVVSDNAANLENEEAHKLDEDKAYGAYVTQRLNNIQNATVKQNIKYEIDYLFYSKMKKLSQNNE